MLFFYIKYEISLILIGVHQLDNALSDDIDRNNCNGNNEDQEPMLNIQPVALENVAAEVGQKYLHHCYSG